MTPEAERVSGKEKLLETCHRYELGWFQAYQTVSPDVESSEASQSLKDRGFDRRDEIIREIQLLKRPQLDEPSISH